MDLWTLIRFLHILALALFVGGQLVLVAAVVPVTRRQPDDTVIRAIGARFGIASLVALAVLVATGVAMADHFGRWSDGTLQVKLAFVVAVGVLGGLHAVAPRSRVLSAAVLAGSLVIVWLVVSLAH